MNSLSITCSTGNLYLEGPTGWVQWNCIPTVENITEMTSTEDNIPFISSKSIEMSFRIRPHEHRRIMRTFMGWKARGPLRYRQLMREMKRLERKMQR